MYVCVVARGAGGGLEEDIGSHAAFCARHLSRFYAHTLFLFFAYPHFRIAVSVDAAALSLVTQWVQSGRVSVKGVGATLVACRVRVDARGNSIQVGP